MGNRKWERKMAHMSSEEHQQEQFRGRIAGGIVVIFFGLAILLERSGVFVADWLVSGGTILLGIGIVSLIKHRFKKNFAWVITAIGAILLFNDLMPNVVNTAFILPAVLIIIGISFFTKAFSSQKKKANQSFDQFVNEDSTGDDYFESTSMFGGVEKIVMSKNFKGAKITSMFSGQVINLTQANIEKEASIQVNAMFGGVELIVPSNWKVVSDLSSFFGGVEDNRSVNSEGWKENEKTLYLKGSCAFGGIDIKSYS